MSHNILCALAIAVALAATRAQAQSREVFPSVPQMQLTAMTGELSIEAINQPETIAGQKLPYIRSGSVVRVLSGQAEFESDFHVIVRARKGDAFRFTANAVEGSKPGAVRIAAVAVGKRPTLKVSVGDHAFRIGERGVINIAGTGPGESTVGVEGGDFQTPVVEVRQEGTLMSSSRGMLPGQPLIVGISTATEFINEPMDLAALTIVRKNDTLFELKSLYSSDNHRVSLEDNVDRAVARWPVASQRTAEMIIDKYGLPDKVSSKKLIWNGNGAWQRTTVNRSGSWHGFPSNHEDIIEQSISHYVPNEKVGELVGMGIGLTVDRERKMLSAVSDSEEVNFLAINLAHDVINGEMTPEEAKEFYARTITLSAEGKSSSYTQRILFHQPE